jgi:hypothetical protein
MPLRHQKRRQLRLPRALLQRHLVTVTEAEKEFATDSVIVTAGSVMELERLAMELEKESERASGIESETVPATGFELESETEV